MSKFGYFLSDGESSDIKSQVIQPDVSLIRPSQIAEKYQNTEDLPRSISLLDELKSMFKGINQVIE